MNVTPILARIRELALIFKMDTIAVASQEQAEKIAKSILMNALKILVPMAIASTKSILTNVCVKLDISV